MRSVATIGLACAFLLAGPTAPAQEAPPPEPSGDAERETSSGRIHIGAFPGLQPVGAGDEPADEGEKDAFEWYKEFFEREMNYIGRSDYWGAVTSQLPKGYLGITYQFNSVEAGGFWDGKGNRGSRLVDPIELDMGAIGGVRMDLRPGGHAFYHKFQISYGILGNFDAYVTIPFIEMETYFDPVYEVRGALPSQVFGTTLDQFFRNLERLGRPRPKLRFSTNGPELNDVEFGVSWNYYKAKHFSGALTFRCAAPTGKIANEDNWLDLMLGPEIDRGNGSWLIGFSAGFDVRLPDVMDFVTFSLQVDVNQALPQKRKIPHFTKPDEAYRNMLKAVDPEVGSYIDTFFPDLSAYGGQTFTIWPGTFFGGMASVNIDLQAIGLSLEYDYVTLQPAVLRDVPEAALSAIGEARAAAGMTEQHLVIGAGTGALMAAYIPLVIKGGYDWNIGGTNGLVKSNNWSVGASLYVPLNPPPRPPIEYDAEGNELPIPRDPSDPRW
jgi:hypothetical protein